MIAAECHKTNVGANTWVPIDEEAGRSELRP